MEKEVKIIAHSIAIKDLQTGDKFNYIDSDLIYTILLPECMPNIALVESPHGEREINNQVFVIKLINKTETEMETTNQKTEMFTLNEVNGNVETIRMKVLNSLGSLFTKDDVIRVIDMIVVEKQKPIEQSNSNLDIAKKFDALIISVSEELESMEEQVNDAIDEDKIKLDTYDIEFEHYSGNKYGFEVENPTFSIPFQSDIEGTLADSKTSILQELKSFKENNLK